MRVAWAALVLLLLAPSVAAEPVIVVFHAHPDPLAGEPGADPFSRADALPLPGLDPGRLPATRADGVLLGDPAPEGNPESAVAHVRDLQRLLGLREATGAGAILLVSGALQPGRLLVNVSATATEDLGRVEARVVLVEDGVPFEGRALRHVARAVAEPEVGNLSEAATLRFERAIPIPEGVDAGRVGVAVLLRSLDGGPLREPGEVVQAAAWTPRQDGPTRQSEKAVLIEHLTATWCEPCAASGSAIDLLASRDATAATGAAYVRAPGAWTFAGLAGGALVALVLLRRLRA